MRLKLIFIVCLTFVFASFAIAQEYQPAGDAWITKWWMLDKQVINTGGFEVSAETDWLSEGTGGRVTQESVSTVVGVGQAKGTVNLPDNGGAMGWTVLTIDPEDGNNMSTIYGGADDTDFDTYAIIVVISPDARGTILHPAHDDYGHIWLNGVKVYDNPTWTGGATTVTTPTDVDLMAGENVLLYRCGESGGSDYFNLHFEASDTDLKIVPTMNDEFFDVLTPVDPKGKVGGTWGGIKKD